MLCLALDADAPVNEERDNSPPATDLGGDPCRNETGAQELGRSDGERTERGASLRGAAQQKDTLEGSPPASFAAVPAEVALEPRPANATEVSLAPHAMAAL